jgi:hypothetical protein
MAQLRASMFAARAPGTRDTDALSPSNSVQEVHGILLTGGSAYGLDAAGGVMRWLEERGHGFHVGPAVVPIVSAVIFDLWVDDFSDALRTSSNNPRIRPDAQAGYLACQAANSEPVPQGNVGAGAGATLGKLNGPDCAMKGGIGSASLCVHGVTVASSSVSAMRWATSWIHRLANCWQAPACRQIAAHCWIFGKRNLMAMKLPNHQLEATPPLAWWQQTQFSQSPKHIVWHKSRTTAWRAAFARFTPRWMATPCFALRHRHQRSSR